MLDSITIVMMLLAALLHASWHALVKVGANQISALAGMGLIAAVVAACGLPFVSIPSSQVWIVIACSVFLHLGYKLSLARSYAFGDLSQAYPMARGLVPLFATAIAFLLLGQSPTAAQLAGIAVVSGGLLWLAIHSLHAGVDHRLFPAALAAGLTVAGYSVLDAYGTRIAADWASFTVWLVVVDSGSFFALVYLIKGRSLRDELWCYRLRTLTSGLFGVGSFAVFLWALSRSPVGPVAALREASVLFATIIGMIFYKESRSAHRLGAVAAILLGLMVITALR